MRANDLMRWKQNESKLPFLRAGAIARDPRAGTSPGSVPPEILESRDEDEAAQCEKRDSRRCCGTVRSTERYVVEPFTYCRVFWADPRFFVDYEALEAFLKQRHSGLQSTRVRVLGVAFIAM